MSFSWRALANNFLGEHSNERRKTLYLVMCFFLVIASYTLAREIRDTIFVNVVGREYVPWARIWAMIILVPAIILYSRLVDVLRRHHLLYVYSLTYGIGLLAIAYFLSHPTIGLHNSVADKYRFFGWFSYFFLEGFNPFVVSLFWAFSNSITDTELAKHNYALITAGSKLGGMMAAGFGVVFLEMVHRSYVPVSDVAAHQVVLYVAAFLLLLTPICIYLLMGAVPKAAMHGYEAAYIAERKKKSEEKNATFLERMKGTLSGLYVIVSSPYVFGIFGLVFFWETIKAVLGYHRIEVGINSTQSLCGFSCYLFQSVFFLHLVGFLIAIFGVRTLIERLGERGSLLLVPLVNGVLLFYYLSSKTAWTVNLVYVLISAVNYALATPLREILYIPTTKDMKFKAKSWIDAFGAKIAKGFGSTFNIFSYRLSEIASFYAHNVFFAVIIGLWFLASHLLGRRFEKAVDNKEVIGADRV